MSDLPQGDPLKPKRPLEGEAEPQPPELDSQLEEVQSQPLAEAGSGVDSPPPAPTPNIPGGPPPAKLQGEDEGPLGGGGQDLETGGGGGR